MTEPAVALTDYALAAECALLAVLVGRARGSGGDAILRRWWVAFFTASALAPLLGGTVHGFYHGEQTALWPATLVAIGAAACAGWAIGARMLLSPRAARALAAVAALELAAYAIFVVAVSDRFAVAIVNYAPAALFLLLAFAVRGEWPGAGGLALAAVAAAVQQLGWGFHAVGFDHNAVYHVLQGAAFVAIFSGARSAIAGSGP